MNFLLSKEVIDKKTKSLEKKDSLLDKLAQNIQAKLDKAGVETQIKEKIESSKIPGFSELYENIFKQDIKTDADIAEFSSLIEEANIAIENLEQFRLNTSVITELKDLFVDAKNYSEFKEKVLGVRYIKTIFAIFQSEHLSAENNIKYLAKLEESRSINEIEELMNELNYQAEELSQGVLQDTIDKINDASQRRANKLGILFDEGDTRQLMDAENHINSQEDLEEYEAKVRLLETSYIASDDATEALEASFKENEIPGKDKIKVLKDIIEIYKALLVYDEKIDKEVPNTIVESITVALAKDIGTPRYAKLLKLLKNEDHLNMLVDVELFIESKTKTGIAAIAGIFKKNNNEDAAKEEAIMLRNDLLLHGTKEEHNDVAQIKELAPELVPIYQYAKDNGFLT